MPAIPITLNYVAAIFDGSNGDDVVATALAIAPVGNWAKVSESSTELVISGRTNWAGDSTYTLDVGGAVIGKSGDLVNIATAEVFARHYRLD